MIIGTPTQPGVFAAAITLTDASGRTATSTFSLTVVVATLIITDSNGRTPPVLPAGTVGVAYDEFLEAQGGSQSTYTWIVSGALPPGILPRNGPGCPQTCALEIVGTPTQAGTYAFTAQVRDSLGNTAQANITIVINSGTPPQISSTSPLPAGSFGQLYSFSFAATGGNGGYRWSFVGPSPDSGLQLSSAGTLSGSLTVANDCSYIWTQSPKTFQVMVTDSAGQSSSPKAFCLPSYYLRPQVTSLNPTTIPQDSGAHSITVSGLNFRSDAYVYVQSKGSVPTTYVNSTTLTFTITTDPLTWPKGAYTIWVVQPFAQDVSNMDKTFTIQ